MGCRALYSQHSKINHSCEPNVKLNFIENSAKLEIIATRKIQINEEIGMDYTAASFTSNVSEISDADERKKILKGLGLKETSNSLLFRIQFELSKSVTSYYRSSLVLGLMLPVGEIITPVLGTLLDQFQGLVFSLVFPLL